VSNSAHLQPDPSSIESDPALSCLRAKRAHPGVLFDQCYGSKRFTGSKLPAGPAGGDLILRRISGEPTATGGVAGHLQTRQIEVSNAEWIRAEMHVRDGRQASLGALPRAGRDHDRDQPGGGAGSGLRALESGESDPLGGSPGGDRALRAPLADEACAAQPFERATYVPRSVTACGKGEWSRFLVNKRDGLYQFVRFDCGSWRCQRCAPRVNARQAFRIERAIRGFDLSQVSFVTLTFDRTRFRNAAEAWRHAHGAWKRFRDALVYELGIGVGRAKAKARVLYVQVWEQHASGWPHLHALLISPELGRRVHAAGSYSIPHGKTGEPRPVWRFVRQVLRGLAVGAGFGPICDLQFVDKTRERIAGYLVKVARELTEATGKDQRPLFAPIHFRRLTSTPRLLESLHKESEFTGCIAPFELDEAPLALELGIVPLSLKLRLLTAGVLIPPEESPPCPKPSPVPSAKPCSIRAASRATGSRRMASLNLCPA
jgi:hypothetical protein